MTGHNRGVQQRRGGALAVALLLFSSAAHAQKKTVLVSAGDCADPTLITAARELRAAGSSLLGPQLVDGETVLDIVRPRPTRTLAELDRQLDSARTLFYGGQADRALELVDRVLEEVERTAPEHNPWNTTTTALVLKALIARGAEKPKDASEAFRQIARIDSSFKLDPDAFPPSVLSAFEAVKKEVARARKTMVLLRAETGDATVFVDGRAMGPSPLKLELIPGSYRVAMMQESTSSFTHRLEVPRDTKLSLDLAFERSVSTNAPLCLSSRTDEGALKLAQLVAAERVLVVRNLASRGEPLQAKGVMYDVVSAQKERERATTGSLSALAEFLVTGREPELVKAPTDTPRESASAAPLSETTPRETAPVVLTPSPTAPAAEGASPARVVSFVLIGAGLATFAAGMVTFASLGTERDRFLSITPMGMLPAANTTARTEALSLMSQLDANRDVTLLLAGAGVGLGAAGVLGLVLFPSAPVKVSAAVTPGQGALVVRGSF